MKYITDLIEISSQEAALRKLMKQSALQLSAEQDKKEFFRDFVVPYLFPFSGFSTTDYQTNDSNYFSFRSISTYS